jgi:hypothetical protein
MKANSSLSILADEIDAMRPVRTLARSDRRRASRDLGAAGLRALREKPLGLLFYRHASQAGLKPQTLGHFVIEITDDDRRHRDASVR